MASSKGAFSVRFSLASLLLVVTALSIWLGRTSYVARKQKKTIQTISATGGMVIDSEDGGPPDWIRTAIGEEYFRKVKAVDFATNMGRRKGSAEPKVTDEALAELASLASIEVLELSHNESVTDSQLIYLSPLKNIKTIYLHRTRISGQGLIHLTRLTRLESLALGGTHIGDEGLEHIARIKRLKWLDLENTKVTDKGAARLAELENLENLRLNNTDITDESLTRFHSLKKLKELGLTGTRITAEGVRSIEVALPNCSVSYPFALGRVPDESPLFPANEKPSAAEINAQFKLRGIDGHVGTDASKPGSPIVSLFLGSATLSDEVILGLIENMPQLETLVLRRGLAGNRLLEGLKFVDRLCYLELTETNISIEGLQHLLPLQNLRELYLNSTAITDEELYDFPPLNGLRYLSFEHTRVTKEGIEKLRQRLPDCRITF